MSVLIKGMEMPTNCLECVFYRRTDPIYDYCCISSATPKGYVPKDCPLVPVPPHGRLIDADALEDYCSRLARDEWNESTCTSWGYAYASFANDVEDASTIIEAEEGET